MVSLSQRRDQAAAEEKKRTCACGWLSSNIGMIQSLPPPLSTGESLNVPSCDLCGNILGPAAGLLTLSFVPLPALWTSGPPSSQVQRQSTLPNVSPPSPQGSGGDPLVCKPWSLEAQRTRPCSVCKLCPFQDCKFTVSFIPFSLV